MKVMMVNGSSHANGNTAAMLAEMKGVFEAEGAEVTLVQVGSEAVRGCVACDSCGTSGKCVFDDVVNKTAPIFEACDGLVVGSPVYYASTNATLVAYLDRLFFSSPFDKTMKVGASVVVSRRGEYSATFDDLNKYFTISGMLVASSPYWDTIHGLEMGEPAKAVMRALARKMSFLMKSIALGKEKYGLPEKEEPSGERTA